MMERSQILGHRILLAVLGCLVVITLGTLGYVLLTDWPVLDALYMAVITISTVGFREVHELRGTTRLFTIALIILGVGSFTYLISTVHNYLIAGQLFGRLEKRAMLKQLSQLKDHVIVCGYGLMGVQVASDFKREHTPVAVIDAHPDRVQAAISDGHVALEGDAEDEETLRAAGIERARALIAVVDEDASNLMVVFTARSMQPKLFIVARANHFASESKLQRAGANRVLWPYGIAGRRMAQMALRPNVVEFLEFVMHDEELELWLEEATIAIGAKLDGMLIGDAAIRQETGANIVALRARDGAMIVAPTASTRLQAGDIIVALGTREQLQKLREMTR